MERVLTVFLSDGGEAPEPFAEELSYQFERMMESYSVSLEGRQMAALNLKLARLGLLPLQYMGFLN
jgi:hypothetical protein